MAKQTNLPAPKPSLEDVRAFLQQLHEKMDFYDPEPLFFRKEKGAGGHGKERTKNRAALDKLHLSLSERNDRIRRLRPEDYVAGPEPDGDPPPSHGPLWQFGLHIGRIEVYIKLQLGFTGAKPVCISFHEVEKAPLRYPFRPARPGKAS